MQLSFHGPRKVTQPLLVCKQEWENAILAVIGSAASVSVHSFLNCEDRRTEQVSMQLLVQEERFVMIVISSVP